MFAEGAESTLDHRQRPDTWRLRVIAEAEPSALSRVLQPFQNLNLVPLRIHADRIGSDYLEISIDIAAADSAPPDLARLIAAKLRQLPIVIVAVACDSPRGT